jgi:uncharacterized protein
MTMRWLAILMFCVMPLAAVAQTYPSPLSDTVSDHADALTAEVEARMTAALRATREETGVQVMLAVIGSRADYGDTGRMDAFAKGLFNAWGIGDATRNDGVLILLALTDREVRVALGSGYGPVWDGAAQRVVDDAMLPLLRAGDAAEAAEAGVLAVTERIARPFATGQDAPTTSQGDGLLPWVLAALAGFFLLSRMQRRRATYAGLTSQAGDHAGQGPRDPAPLEERQDRDSGPGGGRSDGGGASGRW